MNWWDTILDIFFLPLSSSPPPTMDAAPGSLTGDRWTQLTLLDNIMTHTTVTQRNSTVSSAIVNPLFSTMSKRAGEYFASSVSGKNKQFHCSAMIARKTCDEKVDTDYHALLPPEYQAGGDSKREHLRQQDSQNINITATGASSSSRQLRLLQKILQVERKIISSKYFWVKTTSRSSMILRRMSSRRARTSTNPQATAYGFHLGLQRITKTSKGWQ